MIFKQITAFLLAAAIAHPALASPCGDQVDALDEQVRQEETKSIAASTSGKSTASSREAQGITASEGRPPIPEAPPAMSAEAGKGGDLAQQAKVSIEQARAADRKGDTKSCEEALAQARKQIKAAP